MIDLVIRFYDWLKEKGGATSNRIIVAGAVFILGYSAACTRQALLDVKQTLSMVQATQIEQARIETSIQHDVDKVAKSTDEISLVLINKLGVTLPVGLDLDSNENTIAKSP